MPDQETYGRFTPGAWEIIKKAKLTEEEQDMLRFMIETKTKTISKEEAKALLYGVLKYNNDTPSDTPF